MHDHNELPESVSDDTIAPQESQAPQAEKEETVVSVWNASGFGGWMRRRKFDGYTQYETLEENGKVKTHNIYTGYYYTRVQEKPEKIRYYIVYTLVGLITLALMLLCTTRVIYANRRWAGLTGFVALGAGCWYLYALVNEFVVPQRRTIGDYRASSLGLKYGALTTACACWATALVTAVFLLIQHGDYLLQGLVLLGELVCGGLMLLVNRMESGVEYSKVRSELAHKYTM